MFFNYRYQGIVYISSKRVSRFSSTLLFFSIYYLYSLKNTYFAPVIFWFFASVEKRSRGAEVGLPVRELVGEILRERGGAHTRRRASLRPARQVWKSREGRFPATACVPERCGQAHDASPAPGGWVCGSGGIRGPQHRRPQAGDTRGSAWPWRAGWGHPGAVWPWRAGWGAPGAAGPRRAGSPCSQLSRCANAREAKTLAGPRSCRERRIQTRPGPRQSRAAAPRPSLCLARAPLNHTEPASKEGAGHELQP